MMENNDTSIIQRCFDYLFEVNELSFYNINSEFFANFQMNMKRAVNSKKYTTVR